MGSELRAASPGRFYLVMTVGNRILVLAVAARHRKSPGHIRILITDLAMCIRERESLDQAEPWRTVIGGFFHSKRFEISAIGKDEEGTFHDRLETSGLDGTMA
jgi:hypothetical protein